MAEQNHWFEREMISETIARIWEPFVHPFFRANIFHVRCKEADLVVDFGMGLRSLQSFLATDPDRPIVAVAMSTLIMWDRSTSLSTGWDTPWRQTPLRA